MTLRQKILMLGLVAIACMGTALWLQYQNYLTQSRSVAAVTRNIRAVSSLSSATHQMQRERGLTTIDHSSAEGQALADQLPRTDAALDRLASAGVRIAGFEDSLARLRSAAAGGAQRLNLRDGYNELLQRLIDEMDKLISDPGMTVAKAELAAHTRLMMAKEFHGQIRATLGYWIKQQRSDPLVLNQLIRLKGLRDEELRKFALEASSELREIFVQQFSGLEVERTQAAIDEVTSGRLSRKLDLKEWWSMSTAAIDRLNFVEDYSLQAIEKKAEGEREQLRDAMRFGVSVTLVAGLAVFLLTVSAIVTLLRALDRILASMELITTSQDFGRRIPADAKDEIGRISRSFNQLLDIAEHLLREKDYLATTDPLTGINNRRQFAKVLGDEAERKRRHETPMSLIIFDVDHFKRVNDVHGHGVGDEVLRRLADLVKSAIRATDCFGRWGGEEFVLLLRDDDCEAAAVAAEKLRGLIAGADFPGVGRLTCSFGVAPWQLGDTDASLVARADKALYVSKRAGRNRVTRAQ